MVGLEAERGSNLHSNAGKCQLQILPPPPKDSCTPAELQWHASELTQCEGSPAVCIMTNVDGAPGQIL